jgi:hypothetical protein
MTLKIQNQTAIGLILFADVKQRCWSGARMTILATLIQQFAQVYHHLPKAQVNNPLPTQPSHLLNWYQHRALGILHQATTASLDSLPILEQMSDQGSTQLQSGSQPRRRQLLHHLKTSLSAMLPMVTQEKRQLMPRFSAIKISSLLEECLACVPSDYQQKQLAPKIYSLDHIESLDRIEVSSDPVKLACVLVELLSLAAKRAPLNSQVELWYRPFSSKGPSSQASFLELALIEPHQDQDPETTPVHSPPSPPWQILVTPVQSDDPTLQMCQQMMVLLKGRLQFYQLRDNRRLNRLVLPLAQDEDDAGNQS